MEAPALYQTNKSKFNADMMLVIINKKIKVELSKDELLGLKHCIEMWISTLNFISADMEQKAHAQVAWEIHQKVMNKLAKLQGKQQISFNYITGHVMQVIILDLFLFDNLDAWHNNVLTRINFQLHKQS